MTDSQNENKNTPTLSPSSLTVNTYESELINIDSQDNNNTDLDSGLNSDVNSQENNNFLENDIISRIDKLEKTVQTLVNNEVNFQNKKFSGRKTINRDPNNGNNEQHIVKCFICQKFGHKSYNCKRKYNFGANKTFYNRSYSSGSQFNSNYRQHNQNMISSLNSTNNSQLIGYDTRSQYRQPNSFLGLPQHQFNRLLINRYFQVQ